MLFTSVIITALIAASQSLAAPLPAPFHGHNIIHHLASAVSAMTAPQEQYYVKRDVKAHGVHVVGVHVHPASGSPVAEPAGVHQAERSKEANPNEQSAPKGGADAAPAPDNTRRSLVAELD